MRFFVFFTVPLPPIFQLQILPVIIPATYFFLLPSSHTFLSIPDSSPFLSPPTGEYTPIATTEDELAGEEEGSLSPGPKRGVALSLADKWRLVKPLLGIYMFPLCEHSSRLSNFSLV